MIISRTPLRISLAGGGTDLKEYYKDGGGAVISTAINKYVYITINKRFEDTIRLGYSKTEIVNDADSIEHNAAREALKFMDIGKGIEITVIADIPARGSGLGSSSSFLVGLLNALHAYKNEFRSPAILAKEACELEIEKMNAPIGKQDQYIAAYGGFKFIKFDKNGDVFVDPIICPEAVKRELESNLMLFYTAIDRSSNHILEEQSKKMKMNRKELDRIKELAYEVRDCINKKNLDKIGTLLDENWQNKKKLASKISNPLIDEYYQKALDAGALGGKLCGAGGGGFLMLYSKKEHQNDVRKALKELKELEFNFEPTGSQIIFVGS
jgi:D-glycero-alpha-D-manno-heptose-7-phosphate kinase